MLDQRPLSALRLTDRKVLLRRLSKLNDPDPTIRADAALKASELLRRKGVSWISLIPLDRNEMSGVEKWPIQATKLLGHAELTVDERAYVKRVAAWRLPGSDCLARLATITARVGQP